MSSMIDLERRLQALEKAVAELQTKTQPSQNSWIERTAGMMADNPAFDEIVRLGRGFRESQPYPEGSEP